MVCMEFIVRLQEYTKEFSYRKKRTIDEMLKPMNSNSWKVIFSCCSQNSICFILMSNNSVDHTITQFFQIFFHLLTETTKWRISTLLCIYLK